MRKATKKNNVTLREKELTNNNISLYLDIYRDGVRKYEFLKLYINKKARTTSEREQNRNTLILAEEIRTKRETELNMSVFGLKDEVLRNVDFIEYFKSYIDNYAKKDVKILNGVLQRFKDFLKQEYGLRYEKGIKAFQLNNDMMQSFLKYLQEKSIGSGASTYFIAFKRVIKRSIEHNVIIKNPCAGIVLKVDNQSLKKDILSIEEMQILIKTTYPKQNKEIRRAFIFSLYCGLRFCDVKELKFSNVDYSNKLLIFEQLKTKGRSNTSGVIIPLNDSLISLIGNPQKNMEGEYLKESFIFNLPSQTTCSVALLKWTAKANINKHITWHCARHSFAVNILNNGANIKTVASLLGHSGLKHTEKYTRAVDRLKEAAINSLPELKL